MPFVLFPCVIVEQLFAFVWFWETKIKIYLSLLPIGLERTRYRAICCGCYCGPRIIESAVPALFSNTPSIWFLSLLEMTWWDFPLLFSSMMDALLFLSSVPFAQKLSGKGNPLLWWERWLYSKGKYLHNTRDSWAVIVAHTLHPTCFMIHFDVFVLSLITQ